MPLLQLLSRMSVGMGMGMAKRTSATPSNNRRSSLEEDAAVELVDLRAKVVISKKVPRLDASQAREVRTLRIPRLTTQGRGVAR